MKIENMNLTEIEEYLKDFTDEDTNLYMRCLECNEYKPICKMNVFTEVCNDCEDERKK